MSQRIRWRKDKQRTTIVVDAVNGHHVNINPCEWTKVTLPYARAEFIGKVSREHDGSFSAYVRGGFIIGWQVLLLSSKKSEAKRVVNTYLREQLETDVRNEVTARLNGSFVYRPDLKEKQRRGYQYIAPACAYRLR